MSLTTVILLALALAMDAFAVSLSTGMTMCRMQLRHAFRMAAFFGGFQAIMPIAGWALGRIAASYIRAIDHWVAFVLLGLVGGKMIYEALKPDKEDEQTTKDPHNVYVLLTLSVATSIDAAAVGVTLSFLDVAIVQPAIIIGIITFGLSLVGTWFGCRMGNFFGKKIEILGGLVLIGIGVKILIEHLFFS